MLYSCGYSTTGSLQGRLVQELHESSDVPFGPCGISEVKKFQAVLPGYQLDEHLKPLSSRVSKPKNTFTCIIMTIITLSSPACPPSLLVNSTAINARRDSIKIIPAGESLQAMHYTELFPRRVEVLQRLQQVLQE